MVTTATRQRSQLDEVLERGIIRIAVTWSPPPETGFPPEFWIDGDGEAQGIAIEIGKILASDLGVQPEWVNVAWEDQFAALFRGDVDLLPKPSLTPARALEMEFSNRLMAFEVVAIVRRDSGLTIERLREPGRRLSAWKGSSCVGTARWSFPDAEIIEYEDENEGRRAVSEGLVDGIVTDAVTKVAMEQRPDIDFIRKADGQKVVLAREYGHFAVRIGDQRFLNYLNSWISYRRADGVLDYWTEDWWLSFMAH
ncbi:MAG: transporter substrate-binding domain-containing protein [Chloroflexota bacterium]